jgi:phospholipase/carboxylesterase
MTTAETLDGPRLEPQSGAADALVVLLHGLGADGNDLISLAPMLARSLPRVAFAAPNAPFPCDMAPFGFQWFSFRSQAPADILAGVERAAPVLAAFLDAELARCGVAPARLALLGFSQGTMMALHVGLRRAAAPAAIVGFSGALIAPERLPREIRARPPVTLVHGDADPVVPHAALAAAEAALAAQGVPVESTTRPGLGHGIDETGIALASRALVAALGAPAATREAGA